MWLSFRFRGVRVSLPLGWIAAAMLFVSAAYWGTPASWWKWLVAEAHAGGSWTYEQNFNALSIGDLHNQDSWTSPEGKLNVSTAQVYEGARAVEISNDTTPYGANRSFGNTTGTGTFFYAMRVEDKTAFNSGGSQSVRIKTSLTSMRVLFNNADICIGNGSDTCAETLVSGYTSAAWYLLEGEYDIANTKFRARVMSTSTWGAWSNWVVNANFTGIITFGVYGGTGAGSTLGYLDTISGTDPSAGSSPPTSPTSSVVGINYYFFMEGMTSSTCLIGAASTTSCVGSNLNLDLWLLFCAFVLGFVAAYWLSTHQKSL